MQFLRKCPACGRRFRLKATSRRLVDTQSDVERIVRAVAVLPPTSLGMMGMPQIYAEAVQEVPVERETFDVACECGHCGNRWTETLTEVGKG